MRKPFSVYCAGKRVGAPKLQQLPLKNEQNQQVLDLKRDYETSMFKFIRDILLQHGIPEGKSTDDAHGFTFDVVGRNHQYQDYEDYNPAILTIHVVAPWTENSVEVWRKAAKALKTRADDFFDGCGRGGIDIFVEIMAFELTRKIRYCWGFDEVSTRDWEFVREKIGSIVNSFKASRYNWNLIMLTKMDYGEATEKNPITVTVSMERNHCDEMSIELLVRLAVQALLDQMRLDWSLHVNTNTSW